jgi:hypothetical protein
MALAPRLCWTLRAMTGAASTVLRGDIASDTDVGGAGPGAPGRHHQGCPQTEGGVRSESGLESQAWGRSLNPVGLGVLICAKGTTEAALSWSGISHGKPLAQLEEHRGLQGSPPCPSGPQGRDVCPDGRRRRGRP